MRLNTLMSGGRVSEVVARRGGLDHVALCRVLKSKGTCGRWIEEIDRGFLRGGQELFQKSVVTQEPRPEPMVW
jgi:hypothetical protein